MPRNKSEKDPFADRPALPPGWEWLTSPFKSRPFYARNLQRGQWTECKYITNAVTNAWSMYNKTYVAPAGACSTRFI